MKTSTKSMIRNWQLIGRLVRSDNRTIRCRWICEYNDRCQILQLHTTKFDNMNDDGCTLMSFGCSSLNDKVNGNSLLYTKGLILTIERIIVISAPTWGG